MIVNKLLIL